MVTQQELRDRILGIVHPDKELLPISRYTSMLNATTQLVYRNDDAMDLCEYAGVLEETLKAVTRRDEHIPVFSDPGDEAIDRLINSYPWNNPPEHKDQVIRDLASLAFGRYEDAQLRLF